MKESAQRALEQARAQLNEARLQAEREKAQRRKRCSEHQLLERAMAGVTPLRTRARVPPEKARPAPIPQQRLLDERAALQESLSDAFDASTLLNADERLSFRRDGIGPDVTTKLRRGVWAVQDELDLHGMRRDEAREALSIFVAEAHGSGLRCVRVIHGKGLGSPGRAPVLRGRVPGWLVQKKEVIAFVQAGASAGGSGALLVLLAQAASTTHPARNR